MSAPQRCPICKRELPRREGRPPFGPFCSARCRSIDLGSWLEGRYGIPVTEDENEDEGTAARSSDGEPSDAQDSVDNRHRH